MIDQYLTTLEMFTLTKAAVLYLGCLYLVRGARERDPSPDTRTLEQRILADVQRGMSYAQAADRYNVSYHRVDGIVHAAALRAVQTA